MQRRSVVFKSLRSYSLLVTLFVCIIADVNCDNNSKIAFQFPEFDYKETNKNENAYREFEAVCERNSRCEIQSGIGRIKCIRECISPSCYQEIYRFDELEEGEIDLRLISFKGCFVQRIGRFRHR